MDSINFYVIWVPLLRWASCDEQVEESSVLSPSDIKS